jgi:predicted dehydrogenase
VKQVLQDRSGLTVVRDVSAPTCPPGSVLVRNAFSVISSGTERSRVELSKKPLLGKARERPDLVREVIARARRDGIKATRAAVRLKLAEETPVGYSTAGTVIEVGEAVRDFTPGDRVACAGGGHASHAEIVSVPANLCARVPDGVSLQAAAMTTIGAIALHGVRLADVTLGERVGVIGCGLVGQLACRLLTGAGAEVVALDIDPQRVEQAVAAGAHHGIVADNDAASRVLAVTGGLGLDAVVVTAAAPSSEPLHLAAGIARERGALVLVGDVPIQFPRAALYDKELSFRVSRSYGPGRYDLDYEERGLDYPIGFVRWTEQRNMECVLGLQARGALMLDDLIDEVIPVDDAARAYDRLTGKAQRPRGALVLAYGDPEPSDGEVQPGLVEFAGPTLSGVSEKKQSKAPVRVALIGPGGFAGRILVPALVHGGAKLELVGGGSGPSAEAATRNQGFARAAESEQAALIDDAVDAVVIATRHASHASLTIGALEAGKHVFCEKPLALTSEELEAVIERAAAAPGILAVGFNRRFAPLLRELRDCVVPGGARMVGTYRVSAGQIPQEHWIQDIAQGGGRALGEVCHFVDTLAFLAQSPIATVSASGYGPSGVALQCRDNLSIVLGFANGSVGSVTYAAEGSSRVAKERLEVFSGPRTGLLDDYARLELYLPEGDRKKEERGQDKGHKAEIAAFLRGAEAGEDPVPLSEIENVSRATLAVVESLRTGATIRLVAAMP